MPAQSSKKKKINKKITKNRKKKHINANYAYLLFFIMHNLHKLKISMVSIILIAVFFLNLYSFFEYLIFLNYTSYFYVHFSCREC